MAEGKKYIEQPQEGGRILISEDVIASIAALAVRFKVLLMDIAGHHRGL